MYNYYDANYSCELDITIDDTKDILKQKSIIRKIIEENSFNRIVIYDNSINDIQNLEIIGLYEKNFSKHLLYGESYSYDTNQPYAIVSDRAVNKLGFNRNIASENIIYNSINYNIMGIYAGMYDFSVSPFFYVENFRTQNIHSEFDAVISSDLKKALENEGFSFKLTKNDLPFKSPEFLFCFFIVIAIFSLSFINILTMFSFWTIKMKQTFKVYYIYGCNHINKFFIVSGQVFFISLLGTFLGFIIFLFAYKSLGRLSIVYAESIINYIFILLFTILLLLVLSIYFGIKISKTQEISFRSKE